MAFLAPICEKVAVGFRDGGRLTFITVGGRQISSRLVQVLHSISFKEERNGRVSTTGDAESEIMQSIRGLSYSAPSIASVRSISPLFTGGEIRKTVPILAVILEMRMPNEVAIASIIIIRD